MNSRSIKRTVLSIVQQHLRGNYSDLLTRFSYLASGAHDFIQMTQNPNYLGYKREMLLINNLVHSLRNTIYTPLHIIDLGPGDGTKALKLLNLHGSVIQYTALDISQEMLDKTQQTIRYVRNIEKYFIRCDWHTSSEIKKVINNHYSNTNLFLLLGNTLTNEICMEKFLSDFRNNFKYNVKPVYLLIGIELMSASLPKILAEYRCPENYRLTVRPLKIIGINPADGITDITFNKKAQRIEEWFIVSRNKEIYACGKKIILHSGNKILLSVTYKPNLPIIRKIFLKTGWDVIFQDCEKNQCMVLIKQRLPTTYSSSFESQ